MTGLPIAKRDQLLEERLYQMQRFEEASLFQKFALRLLQHANYTDVRLSEIKKDCGRDAIAITPDGLRCYVAVSSTCTIRKVRVDAASILKDENREPASVLVFITMEKVTNKRYSPWGAEIKADFGLELRIVGRETILGWATSDSVWNQTCDLLGISWDSENHRLVSNSLSESSKNLVRRLNQNANTIAADLRDRSRKLLDRRYKANRSTPLNTRKKQAECLNGFAEKFLELHKLTTSSLKDGNLVSYHSSYLVVLHFLHKIDEWLWATFQRRFDRVYHRRVFVARQAEVYTPMLPGLIDPAFEHLVKFCPITILGEEFKSLSRILSLLVSRGIYSRAQCQQDWQTIKGAIGMASPKKLPRAHEDDEFNRVNLRALSLYKFHQCSECENFTKMIFVCLLVERLDMNHEDGRQPEFSAVTNYHPEGPIGDYVQKLVIESIRGGP